MKKKTIQAAIMKPEEFSHFHISHAQTHSYTLTHTHTNIQNSLAPTADNSVTKPVTISRRSMFRYIKMEVLSGVFTRYLHYIHKHTSALF